MKIKNAILDLLFPRICPFCNTPYTIDSWSCNCDYRQYLIEESKNKKGLKNTEGVRLLCVDKAVAIYYYKGNTKKAIVRLKQGEENSILVFSHQLAQFIKDYLPVDKIQYICTIPKTAREEQRQPINHLHCICKAVASQLSIPYIPVLEKIYETDRQHNLSKLERSANLLGAFEVKDKFRPHVKGKNALIIDDVLTTGGTMSECAKILKIRGAQQVYACTVALTPHDNSITKSKKEI